MKWRTISGALLLLLLLLALAKAVGWRQQKIALLEPLPDVRSTSRAQAPKAEVLLFGDSRIAQWQPIPTRPYRIHRAGHAGETAIRLGGRLPSLLQQMQPRLVIIEAGINDAVAASLVGRHRRAKALAASIDALERMAIAVEHSGARLIFLGVLLPERPNLVRTLVCRGEVLCYVQALDRALERIARQHDAQFIDLTALLRENGQMPERYRRDALHLAPDAYRQLNILLPPTMEDLG